MPFQKADHYLVCQVSLFYLCHHPDPAEIKLTAELWRSSPWQHMELLICFNQHQELVDRWVLVPIHLATGPLDLQLFHCGSSSQSHQQLPLVTGLVTIASR